MNDFDINYYLDFGHKNDNIGTVVRHLDMIKNSNKILVCPCGYGQIVRFCECEGKDVHGIDISKEMVSRKLTKNILEGNVVSLPWEDNTFDLIICADLFEHLTQEDILKGLSELERVSTLNSTLIFRIGSEELDCFDQDRTHLTKENDLWWISKVLENTKFKPYLFCTALGEFVFKKEYSGFQFNSPEIFLWNEIKVGERFLELNQEDIFFYRREDNKIGFCTNKTNLQSISIQSQRLFLRMNSGHFIIKNDDNQIIMLNMKYLK